MISILINNLRVRARHGVLAQERTVGQEFELTLRLDVDYSGSDALECTVNYAAVCDLLARQMQTPSELLEHCAQSLAEAIRSEFPAVRSGKLTLLKLAPPIPYDLGSAGVELEW